MRIKRLRLDLTTDGTGELPSDFPAGSLKLFVLAGESFVELAGAPGAPGEYVFPDVPHVTYFLKYGRDYLVTDARDVDLSFNKWLRDGIVDLDTEVSAHVAVGNLEPWHDRWGNPGGQPGPAPYSELQFSSEELGFSAPLWLFGVNEGATVAIEDTTASLIRQFEEARGDRARLVQLSPRELGPLPDGGVHRYVTAVRVLHLPPFSNDGTAPLEFSGNLEPLPLSELPLDWKVSAFAALAADVHPAASGTRARLLMHSSSSAPDESWSGAPGELLNLGVPQSGLVDLSGTLVYGNPSPTHQGALARATMSFAVPLEVVPGEPPFQLTAIVSVQDRPDKLAGRALLPRIQPPRGLTLDGIEAYSPRTLDTGSHVVAWQPPSGGMPDAYLLRFQRLDRSDTSWLPVPVVQVYVDGSAMSVRVPAGHLQPGQHYVLSVEAILSEGYEVWKRPTMLNDRFIVSRAPALSGLLSVPAMKP